MAPTKSPRTSTGTSPLRERSKRYPVRGRLENNLRGHRDRAMLALGWFGAFRRSELVRIEVADVAFTRDGLVVNLRKSKTNPHGEREIVGIPYASDPAFCPARSLRTWLDAAGIERQHGETHGVSSAHPMRGHMRVRRARRSSARARSGSAPGAARRPTCPVLAWSRSPRPCRRASTPIHGGMLMIASVASSVTKSSKSPLSHACTKRSTTSA